MASKRPDRDSGFTLTEMLIVIVVLGLLAVVIASVFIVISRTTPATDARTDDSRSLLGLTNWLSQDVTSTAEDGFFKAKASTGCDPANVPTSKALVELHWADAGKTFVADYRFVSDSVGSGAIIRYTCLLGGPAEAQKLTGPLRETATGTLAPAPVEVELEPNGSGGHKGLRFTVTVVEADGSQRELLLLDATTSNVRTTLPLPGPEDTEENLAPNALSVIDTVVADGAPRTYKLAEDPNGNPPNPGNPTDVLTVAFPDGPLPAWATISDEYLTVTPDAAAVGTVDWGFTVSDGELAASPTGSVQLTIVPDSATNQPPTVQPLGDVVAVAGEPFSVTLLATDPESDPMSVTDVVLQTGNGAEWDPTSVSGLAVTFKPKSSAGTNSTFLISVTDGTNVVHTSLNVRFCHAEMTSATASVKVNPGSNKLTDDVSVSISHDGACGPLVLQFKPKESEPAESKAFAGNTTVNIGKNDYTWDTPPASGRDVALELRSGVDGSTLDVAVLHTTKK